MKEFVTQGELANRMGVNRKTVTAWKKKGKLKGVIRSDGKIDLQKALEIVPGRVSVKHQQSANARWNKDASPKEPLNTSAEVKDYLDETIGDMAELDIYELQRRNELEKLLLAQIKRRKESGELIDAQEVERDAFNAGKAIKEQCLAIADRTAPLVAAEPDPFRCKEIIVKEVNFILESLSRTFGGGHP